MRAKPFWALIVVGMMSLGEFILKAPSGFRHFGFKSFDGYHHKRCIYLSFAKKTFKENILQKF